jgi:hypothetical protein
MVANLDHRVGRVRVGEKTLIEERDQITTRMG